jgi:hypothetical protein
MHARLLPLQISAFRPPELPRSAVQARHPLVGLENQESDCNM